MYVIHSSLSLSLSLSLSTQPKTFFYPGMHRVTYYRRMRCAILFSPVRRFKKK